MFPAQVYEEAQARISAMLNRSNIPVDVPKFVTNQGIAVWGVESQRVTTLDAPNHAGTFDAVSASLALRRGPPTSAAALAALRKAARRAFRAACPGLSELVTSPAVVLTLERVPRSPSPQSPQSQSPPPASDGLRLSVRWRHAQRRRVPGPGPSAPSRTVTCTFVEKRAAGTLVYNDSEHGFLVEWDDADAGPVGGGARAVLRFSRRSDAGGGGGGGRGSPFVVLEWVSRRTGCVALMVCKRRRSDGGPAGLSLREQWSLGLDLSEAELVAENGASG